MIDHDIYGCEVTLNNKDALKSWNKTISGFLTHSASTGADLTATLEKASEFAIAHACKGLFSLLLGRREMHAVARDALVKAKACDTQNPVSKREKSFISALEAWLTGQPTKSVAELEILLNSRPHDALAMKLSQAIMFMLGDRHGMKTSLEKIADVYRGHPAEGYFNGCYAFTLEETGHYAQAEKHGREALEIAPDDAWGLHAVSHVFDMTARPQEGLNWIEGKEAAWAHCNNFRYHVWWHIALMHLELGNFDRVLELYDEDIRKDKTDDYRDISNATSILLRLEFEGVDVGNRWVELAELTAGRTDDNCLAFADLHYMMALCKSSNPIPATELLTNMQSAEQRHHCEMTATIKNRGVLAATGLEAFRDHNFELAHNCLARARHDLQEIGGSHAQRDIFERLAIESALRGRMVNRAKSLLRERDLHRGRQDNYSKRRWAALSKASSDGVQQISGVAASCIA